MAEVAEKLITFISSKLGETGSVWFVGEEIPEAVETNYVYVRQTRETEQDCLGAVDIDSIGYALELFSLDMAQVRGASKKLKTELRNLGKFSTEFEGAVEFFSVVDADDDYEYRSIPGDERSHATAIDITAHIAD